MTLIMIDEVYNLLIETYNLSKSYFINSEKRIYLPYIFTSLVLAYFVYLKSNNKKGFINYVFNKKVWLSKSAYIDYSLFIFNNLLKITLIAPYLFFGLSISFYINEYLQIMFGLDNGFLTLTQTIIFYTIALTLFNDFLSYLFHYLMHKIPFLWEFHKIHHSATTLNPMTQYRVHPVELIINNFRGIIGFGIVTGFFDYISNHPLDKILFIGANIFTFLFMFLGANLRHSHVKLKYPNFLEKIFISPYQHQIHHSKSTKHFDKNIGSKLAIWDWIFGTLVLSKDAKKINFGLGQESQDYNKFWNTILIPFKKLF